MDDFLRVFQAAVKAEEGVRLRFAEELPTGESVTMGTLEDALTELDSFLSIIDVLVKSGLRPMVAAPSDPEMAATNVRIINAPLGRADAKLEMARRIIQSLDGCGCRLPVKTVAQLTVAVRTAHTLADRL